LRATLPDANEDCKEIVLKVRFTPTADPNRSFVPQERVWPKATTDPISTDVAYQSFENPVFLITWAVFVISFAEKGRAGNRWKIKREALVRSQPPL
jgi:hypothetical protein